MSTPRFAAPASCLLLFVAVAAFAGRASALPCTCGEPAGVTPVCSVTSLRAIASTPTQHFRLCSDIDFAGATSAAPILPSFAGTLDGNGHAIRNLALAGSMTATNVALIGRLTGVVTNLRFVDAHVTGGATNVAILAGSSSAATVRAVHVERATLRAGQNGSRAVGMIVGRASAGTRIEGTTARQATLELHPQSPWGGLGSAGGLVGVLEQSTVRDFQLEVVVRGRSPFDGRNDFNREVGGVVGSCLAGTIDSGAVAGDIGSDSVVGGVFGQGVGCTVHGIDADVTVAARDVVVAGIGNADLSVSGLPSRIENVRVRGSVRGAGYLGGVAGQLTNTTVRNVLVDVDVAADQQPMNPAVPPDTIRAVVGFAGTAVDVGAALFHDGRVAGLRDPLGLARTADQLRRVDAYAGFDITTIGSSTSLWFIDPSRMAFAVLRAQRCGNGTRNVASEACDDGNTANLDGCALTCGVEERPMTSSGVGRSIQTEQMRGVQTRGLRVRFDRDGVVTGLGARNLVGGAWRYLSLYDDQGRSIASTRFQQTSSSGVQVAAAGPARVRSGVVYTVVLHNWGGEWVAQSSVGATPTPFAVGSVEVLGAVQGTNNSVMPASPTTSVPLIEVVYAADP